MQVCYKGRSLRLMFTPFNSTYLTHKVVIYELPLYRNHMELWGTNNLSKSSPYTSIYSANQCVLKHGLGRGSAMY